MNAKSTTDYRFNYKEPGKIISVEVKCCGQHIGEMRFQDGEEKTCPTCGMKYSLRMDYNHFHLTRSDEKSVKEEVV